MHSNIKININKCNTLKIRVLTGTETYTEFFFLTMFSEAQITSLNVVVPVLNLAPCNEHM